MRLSREQGETTAEDARPDRIDMPPSEAQREPSFQDTVGGGPDKLHRGRDFSPLIPPTALHSTFNSSNLDRLNLSGERIPNVASEPFGCAHSGPEVISSRGGVVRDRRLDLQLNLDTNLDTVNQTGALDEYTHGPNLARYDSAGGLNRFSRYEADFKPLNTHVDPEPRTHHDLDQYRRPPGHAGGGNEEHYHEETRWLERNHKGGYPRNRGLVLTTSWFETRRDIQHMSRFVYNWKISFRDKSGVGAEDFLTRLEEYCGITPINDDDFLRALSLLLQNVALLWFRISKDEWRNWSEFKTSFRRRFCNYEFATRVREQTSNRAQGPKENVDDRSPPPPENSFLQEFEYRAETTPAAHKRTPVSTITETTPPPRNSEGPNRGNRNTVDRVDGSGNKSRDNGRQTGFAMDRFDKSNESEVKRNFKDTRIDFKVGEVRKVRVRLLKKPQKTWE